jgi:hypothetical protein
MRAWSAWVAPSARSSHIWSRFAGSNRPTIHASSFETRRTWDGQAPARPSIRRELASVVVRVVVEVALHPVTAESAEHPAGQQVSPVRLARLEGCRPVRAGRHVRLGHGEDLGGDDRLVDDLVRGDPFGGIVPPHPRPVAGGDVLHVHEDLFPALLVPHLAPHEVCDLVARSVPG